MITVVILAKNEEEHIGDAIDSVLFCDEVLVIDDESQDKTPEISKKKGARVVGRKLDRNFSDQRNYALGLSKNEWVLFLDADEIVSNDLKEEILKVVSDNTRDGFYIPRQDILFGKSLKYGELAGKKFLRLGKKNAGKWIGAVHEVWEVQGKTGTLKSPIKHIPHETLSEFITEVNFYSTLRAEELHRQGNTVSALSILLYTKGKFFYVYILKLGFLDGIPGIIVSIMMTFHSFLTRSKLYLLTHRKS